MGLLFKGELLRGLVSKWYQSGIPIFEKKI